MKRLILTLALSLSLLPSARAEFHIPQKGDSLLFHFQQVVKRRNQPDEVHERDVLVKVLDSTTSFIPLQQPNKWNLAGTWSTHLQFDQTVGFFDTLDIGYYPNELKDCQNFLTTVELAGQTLQTCDWPKETYLLSERTIPSLVQVVSGGGTLRYAATHNTWTIKEYNGKPVQVLPAD
jgi:hypothetical protein